MGKHKTKWPGVFRLDDRRWWVQVTATTPAGRKVFRERLFDATMSADQVVAARATMARELRDELRRPPSTEPSPSATVGSYAETWLRTRGDRIRPSTRHRYETSLAYFILPFFGELEAPTVTRSVVEQWVAWAQKLEQPHGGPYAQDTLSAVFTLLCALLRDMAADLSLPDPTVRVTPPRSRRRKVREQATLLPEQLGQLLDTIRSTWSDWYAEVYVMAYTGMRAGELYALQWSDIRPKEHAIHIRQAHWRGQVDETKTRDPRVVAMPPAMHQLLQEHRKRLVRDQHEGLKVGLVFPSDTGAHRFTSALAKVLAEASEAAELPIRVTPQVLRRTFNTLLLELGVPSAVIRALMGHTSAKMTQRYAGVHTERKLDALDVLMRAVDGVGK